ncbi:cytochrome c biogenesis protein ResB [Chitinilyticum piscinae]|uniref:Cytochrome c biogenesis protein ResB n=1 Tax=Chitinilyticum piscinae TaxID=2866724 RepID=A0A8J7FJN4_9NEIS|nr:cytochrome c biogenesis protein ResB [Chitinilyticum piscinae]MBE9608024.1 cytochrome c biogenesis protein ResB [Chitinilyticum piscinae]
MNRSRSSLPRALFDLLSSMRFAVSLLVVLAIASVIGTVLKQNEPYNNYRIEFGEFWFQHFEAAGLFDVYHSAWFLLILTFLVVSTSLCIWRHVPGMLREMRSFRERATLSSLQRISHHLESPAPLAAESVTAHLSAHGYRWRVREGEDYTLYAAKKGSYQKLGYFFAHAAIVVICLGGLMDGNLPLKLAEAFGVKHPEVRSIPLDQIPPASRLQADNLSFRGNVFLSEGSAADVIFLNAGQGYFVQELPFRLQLKAFHIEHYSTGQPKRFASDIDVFDLNGKLLKSGTVEVNKPLIVDGVAIYQSSFGDGGSGLQLRVWDLASSQASAVATRSQVSQDISIAGKRYTLELGDFRPINIQNMGRTSAEPDNLQSAMAVAQSVKGDHNVRNFGPMQQFKLRDETGQAIEYQSYMLPWQEDGAFYMLSGIRREVSESFGFVRIPLDSDNRLDTFMRLRAILTDPAQHAVIARQTTAKAFAAGGVSASGREQFEQITLGVLEQFARGGFPEIDRFLTERVPEAQRNVVAQTYLKVLQGATFEALAIANSRAGLPTPAEDAKAFRFNQDALVAISNLFDYGRPALIQLEGFDEVKGSGFQLTRSPGKNVVYLGSLLLVLGIFCMFYIRENRLWIRLSPQGTLLALTSNRRTADLDREFDLHRAVLLPQTAAEQEQDKETP